MSDGLNDSRVRSTRVETWTQIGDYKLKHGVQVEILEMRWGDYYECVMYPFTGLGASTKESLVKEISDRIAAAKRIVNLLEE